MESWNCGGACAVSCADVRLVLFGHLGTAGAGRNGRAGYGVQQAMALLDEMEADTERTFTYQGETFLIREGLNYANTFLRGTDDYDPFCTALMEAQLPKAPTRANCFCRRRSCSMRMPSSRGIKIIWSTAPGSTGCPAISASSRSGLRRACPMTVRFLFMRNGWLLTPIEAEASYSEIARLGAGGKDVWEAVAGISAIGGRTCH